VELGLRINLCGGDCRWLLLYAATGRKVLMDGQLLINGRLFGAMIAGGLLWLCDLDAGGCADEKSQEAEQRCEEVHSFFHR
jgi:hypothetical protein